MTLAIANQWRTYTDVKDPGHSVVGNVQVLEQVWSPQLENHRDILVYLPPSYSIGQRRYPVVYMHDGQNLFDHNTSYAGVEWQVDETMEALSEEGVEAIVVGVPHMREQRLAEYNPLPGAQVSRGKAYLDFLIHTLKPLIDRDFRTRPDKRHTGIMGSSMGGLISLYAFFYYPHTFGFMGCLSPAFWYGSAGIYPMVQAAEFVPGRIYLDHGTRENSAARMYAMLLAKGYRPGESLRYVKEEEGEHTEGAWARRLPNALRFLLNGLTA